MDLGNFDNTSSVEVDIKVPIIYHLEMQVKCTSLVLLKIVDKLAIKDNSLLH